MFRKQSLLVFPFKAFYSRKANSSRAGTLQSSDAGTRMEAHLPWASSTFNSSPTWEATHVFFPRVLAFPIPSLHLTQKLMS